MKPHIANMKITSLQAHEEKENVLNCQRMRRTIVLGPQIRTANNFQSWNNDIPTLCGLPKDHKITTYPVAGTPTTESVKRISLATIGSPTFSQSSYAP
ncbi:Hypothetical predicted protein [Octopus vulgaris]|uniref:Uncharacterized protein n=1 Tax=Octopus vulgaris TaxID=6645 RepID=A0AA36EWY5_OCTVU|nr:Hypothetical predicted protein [Octopus vulgaris]